jgi:hypothetical protein
MRLPLAFAGDVRDWRCAPPPSPPRSIDHRDQQPQKIDSAVGMPLFSSHAYSIVVSGRKI